MGQNLKNFVQILCSGTEVIWETLVPDHKLRMSASDNDVPNLSDESDSDPEGIELQKYVRNEVYTILKEENLIDRKSASAPLAAVRSGEIGHRRITHPAPATESTQRLESILRESKDIPQHDGHRDESTVPARKKVGIWNPGRSSITLQAPTSARPNRRSLLRGERMAATVLRPETEVLETIRRTEEATPMETEIRPTSQTSNS